LRVAHVQEPEQLTADHLNTFQRHYKQLTDLSTTFSKTSAILLRAAKLCAAPLPDDKTYAEIAKAQADVRNELAAGEELFLNPDRVNTRLMPRLKQLENPFVEAYLNELMRLDSLQGQIRELQAELAKAPELEALSDFANELTEARAALKAARECLAGAPRPLRRSPEDRDRAEKEVRREAKLKDLENQDLTLRRLKEEADERLAAQSHLRDVPKSALEQFLTFLRSPGVVEQLKAIEEPPKELLEILSAPDIREAADALLTTPSKARRELARLLKAVLGKKQPKSVSLQAFHPVTNVLWEKADVARVVKEFDEFLNRQWEDGKYLKLDL
jgi:hypothetical protein